MDSPPQDANGRSYHKEADEENHLTSQNRGKFANYILAEQEGNKKKENATTMVGGISPAAHQRGWHELKDDRNTIDESTPTKKPFDDMGSNENNPSIEIELQETGGTNAETATGGKRGGAARSMFQSFARFGSKNGAGAPSPAAGEEEWSGQYRVYRRRWFGLLQLTLMNTITSWDVSFPFSFMFSHLRVLVWHVVLEKVLIHLWGRVDHRRFMG